MDRKELENEYANRCRTIQRLAAEPIVGLFQPGRHLTQCVNVPEFVDVVY